MRKFLFIILALALGGLSGHARPSTAVSGTTGQASGGVTLAVSTSGFEFTPIVGSLVSPKAAAVNPGGPMVSATTQTFAVSVALRNQTAQGIAFQLGVTATPGQKFHFQVFNSDGVLVWDSLGSISMPLEYLATLKPGQAWHGAASVPLFINGVALPAGTYTLEASLYGTPVFSATTSFVVNKVIVIN